MLLLCLDGLLPYFISDFLAKLSVNDEFAHDIGVELQRSIWLGCRGCPEVDFVRRTLFQGTHWKECLPDVNAWTIAKLEIHDRVARQVFQSF
jgi:hypothetical protein